MICLLSSCLMIHVTPEHVATQSAIFNRKKQVITEEKARAGNGAVTSDDQKAYGSETLSRAVLNFNTIDQAIQLQQVSLGSSSQLDKHTCS